MLPLRQTAAVLNLEAAFSGLKSGMLCGQQASRQVYELGVKDRT